jgi:hypothetical protein
MRLREVVTADGEIWVDENYADKYRRYTHTFTPQDELSPTPMYDGFFKVPPYVVVPGVPVFTSFTEVGRWGIFQPETYRLSNVYHYKVSEVRGTLGLENASAYHVAEVGVFYKDVDVEEGKREFYETPNTPCIVKRRDGIEIGVSSVTNETARFLGHDTFLLTVDIATFGDKLNVNTNVLAFINGKPEIVHARVYGLVSASFLDKTIVAPVVPTVSASSLVTLVEKSFLEFIPEPIPEPPETAMITGSTSGTITVHFEKEVVYYKYVLNFGRHEYYLAFRHGWLYRGATKPGDSGGPLFRIPSREQTGPQ